jgi:hypothetical protein
MRTQAVIPDTTNPCGSHGPEAIYAAFRQRALTYAYADAAGAGPDAARRAELLISA